MSPFHSGLLLNPLLELRVCRVLFSNKLADSFRIQIQRSQNHGVKSGSDIGIPRAKLAFRFKRNLLPQSW